MTNKNNVTVFFFFSITIKVISPKVTPFFLWALLRSENAMNSEHGRHIMKSEDKLELHCSAFLGSVYIEQDAFRM